MDTASPDRLRAIVDRLLASTLITDTDRRLVEEAKAVLDDRPAAAATVRHDSHAVPDPLIATYGVRGAGR
jgi:hypothetical protein